MVMYNPLCAIINNFFAVLYISYVMVVKLVRFCMIMVGLYWLYAVLIFVNCFWLFSIILMILVGDCIESKNFFLEN